jgi:signal recognition particle subunit SRP54
MMGMGGMGGGAPGMGAGAPDLAALGGGKPSKGQQAEEVDFDAIEKALSGQGAMPPGLGGLPGLGKKK